MSLIQDYLVVSAHVTPVTADLLQKASTEGAGFPVSLDPKSEGRFVISSQSSLPLADVCAQIKRSGYSQARKIRIYGEEFETLSDPFPNEIGIAIQVRSRRTLQVRALQLPATLIHRVTESLRRTPRDTLRSAA